jgi:hypothetical protein
MGNDTGKADPSKVVYGKDEVLPDKAEAGIRDQRVIAGDQVVHVVTRKQ